MEQTGTVEREELEGGDVYAINMGAFGESSSVGARQWELQHRYRGVCKAHELA